MAEDHENSIEQSVIPDIDSSVSILVASSAALNIDPATDSLSRLSDSLVEALENAEIDAGSREVVTRCRDLLCVILFELEEMELTSLLAIPLAELQSHLMTPPFSGNTDESLAEVNPTPPDPEALPFEEPPAEDSGSEETGPIFSSDLAMQFWHSAGALRSEAPPALSPELSNRLATLLILSAYEAECLSIMDPFITNFWAAKDGPIQSTMTSQNGKIGLTPAYASLVTKFQEQYKDSLPDHRVPAGTLITTLRALLANKAMEIRPTLIEIASLLFFFGRDENNLLGIPNHDRNLADRIFVTQLQVQHWKVESVNFLEEPRTPPCEELTSLIKDSLQALTALCIGTATEN